jgi:hypothetical protein
LIDDRSSIDELPRRKPDQEFLHASGIKIISES